MMSRYRVYINDIEISSLDDSIYVNDISYSSISVNRSTTALGGRSGSYSGRESLPENKVTVSFAVRKYDTKARQAVVQAVNAWCMNGGWLKVSDRPDQKMYVCCSKPAVVPSVMRWTDFLTIELTAYDYPFWTDEIPTRVVLDVDEVEGVAEAEVFVPGVYKTYVEAEIAVNGNMTGLTITCGETEIELTDIYVTPGNSVVISYTDDHHILQIKSGNTSLLPYRTPESNDDLILAPGNNTVSFTPTFYVPTPQSEYEEPPDVSATCTLIIKGVYL